MAGQYQFYTCALKTQECWLPLLTPITYLCKLQEVHSVAAYLHLEVARVYFSVMLRLMNIIGSC
ncbi:hypothetical protein DXZ79_12605 [Yersinia rochesterensis]|uniref:Uncharacterized protein n=1 Tax=Yersinia rochesterensis TaxID=1604335 RepID=A0A8D4SNK8_9GAMM|nr:hypothetical protein DXZ79_12605 [Yersinia rochesterensis]